MIKLTAATKMALSIAIPTGIYGISFGALSIAAGLNFWQTVALSCLMFTGGSQFAFIGTIAGGGSYPSATTAAALLGIRNALYGMQINRMFKPQGIMRFFSAHLTIDESLATAIAQNDQAEKARGFWVAGIGIFILWNIFTIIGALIGDVIGDPKTYGLDGAAVAAFLGLLWPRIRQREGVAIAIICALATALSLPFLPAGIPILIAAAVAAIIGFCQK